MIPRKPMGKMPFWDEDAVLRLSGVWLEKRAAGAGHLKN